MTDTSNSWIELSVHGFFIGPGINRPVMILRGTNEEHVLPVWLNPAELNRNDMSMKGVWFHQITGRMMKAMDASLLRCEFVDLVGHHQYVELVIKSPSGEYRVRSRADEAMAYCFASNAKYVATAEYMEKCRNLNEDLMEMGANLGLTQKDIATLKQSYIM